MTLKKKHFRGSLQSLGCDHSLNSFYSETLNPIEPKFGVLHCNVNLYLEF